MAEISQEGHSAGKTRSKPRPEARGKSKVEEEAKKDALMKEEAEHIAEGLTLCWRNMHIAFRATSRCVISGITRLDAKCKSRAAGTRRGKAREVSGILPALIPAPRVHTATSLVWEHGYSGLPLETRQGFPRTPGTEDKPRRTGDETCPHR